MPPDSSPRRTDAELPAIAEQLAGELPGPADAPSRRTHGSAETAEAARRVSGRGAARKFVGRVAQLDLDQIRDVVASWRETMRHDSAAWFAAEEALGEAVVRSGRRDEQKPLLVHVADAFTHLVWYGSQAGAAQARGVPAPESRVRAPEATGQYLATVAMLALLVRDHLEDATFAGLYDPFAALVPLAELAPE